VRRTFGRDLAPINSSAFQHGAIACVELRAFASGFWSWGAFRAWCIVGFLGG
jgi:hypothetical protein